MFVEATAEKCPVTRGVAQISYLNCYWLPRNNSFHNKVEVEVEVESFSKKEKTEKLKKIIWKFENVSQLPYFVSKDKLRYVRMLQE